MKPRRALVMFFSLLMLFAQQAAYAHVVSHTGKEPPKEQLAHSKLCGKCVGFEKMSHTASSSSVALLSLELVFAQPVDADYFFRPRTVAAFQSRAPPVLL